MTNIWQPHKGMKRFIASSSNFRTAVDVATATEALNHIFSYGESDFELARAIVRMQDGISRQNIGIGSWKSTGSIYIALERKYPKIAISEGALIDAQEEEFVLWTSAVMLDVEVLADSRQAVMNTNPIAVSGIRADGNAFLVPAAEGVQEDPSDVETSSNAIDKNHWCMEFYADLY